MTDKNKPPRSKGGAGKAGITSSAPQVGVTGQKRSGPKIVGTDGQPFIQQEPQNSEPEKPKTPEADVPALDPRLNFVGQFVIDQNMFKRHFDDMMELFKDIVVIRCETQMVSQGQNLMFYTGISQKYFKPVHPGQPLPMYQIQKRLDGLFQVIPMQPMGMPPGPFPPPPGGQRPGRR